MEGPCQAGCPWPRDSGGDQRPYLKKFFGRGGPGERPFVHKRSLPRNARHFYSGGISPAWPRAALSSQSAQRQPVSMSLSCDRRALS